ncbi:uncharacterized protein PGTG_05232 [Puccinia graminis f. sp. tritici CRL 75-36-700-3]|uniref:Uncharacterized protein n=1 Tax=Puccinia graminis f. sp. tritici (strain CRL 75-36-700-3 / race SCCL) TaxID=418459 RepID=E3K6H8_PUCGT|nr:uncharacterized protein PGTG_05232 [Puccinia graminis f. sp. tritici CRL 75-36-700-3]EFP80007.2 hypothetical protein PGTG_05232 [Puccinia graminis f. sp. tritici CRL 75-36-700-3]
MTTFNLNLNLNQPTNQPKDIMPEPATLHHHHRPGSLTSSPNRISPRRRKNKPAPPTDLSLKTRPVRSLPTTQRVAVVIPRPSRSNTLTKKKSQTLSASTSAPNLKMPSRKRNCPEPLGRFDSDQQPEIIPRLRKKTRQSGPLTPAPTSPINPPDLEAESSEDEILLKPSTHTKPEPKTKPLQLPPSPTSSHNDSPVRSRAKTRSLTRQADQRQAGCESTPVKLRSKKSVHQTAPVNRALTDHSVKDPTSLKTRGRPRQRPLSPSPSSHRSPTNRLTKNSGHVQLLGPESDGDDSDGQATLTATSPLKAKLFKTRVQPHTPNPPRTSPRRAGPSAIDPTIMPDSENVDELLRQIESMIPKDSPILLNQASFQKQRAPDGSVEAKEDDLVSGVDERCFKVLEDAQLAERSDQSDNEDSQASETDDDQVAKELNQQLIPSSNRSPRRLSSVSPLEISAGTTTRLRRLTHHTKRPAKASSPDKALAKEPVAAPKTVASPAKTVVDKDGFPSSVVTPYLHDLLQHLSGVRPLSIRIPQALASSLSDPHKHDPSRIPTILDQTPCLVGLEDLEIELRSILFRSVSQQEENVLLLSGARGSGKTALISRSLSLLSDPLICGSEGFITIKLNGLVHNSDKVALKEMCRQLFSSLALSKDSDQSRKLDQVNRDLDFQPDDSADEDEEEDEDEVADSARRAAVVNQPRFTNYGETLKNLLDVLEPSSSLSIEHDPILARQSHQKKPQNNKALVIILEEFDLFSDLDRQSFLYCLLDSVQGNKRQNGICVIGTTSVVDCLDKLEKRVKSRCQSRIRYLHSPKTEPERIDLLRSLLELPGDHLPEASSASSPTKSVDQKRKTFVQKWNDSLGAFLDHAHTRDWLRSKFMLINDPLVQILQDLNGMVSMIAYQAKRTGQLKLPALNPSELFPTRPVGGGTGPTKPKVMRSSTLISTTLPWWADALSIAEFSVLIACKHLSSTHHNGIFNLEMAWDLYRQHLKRLSFALDAEPLSSDVRAKDQFRPAVVRSQVYGRDAFELAWERLQRLELILPLEVLNSKAVALGQKKKSSVILGKRYELVKLVPFLSQIDLVLLGSSSSQQLPRVGLAHHLLKWAKNSSD